MTSPDPKLIIMVGGNSSESASLTCRGGNGASGGNLREQLKISSCRLRIAETETHEDTTAEEDTIDTLELMVAHFSLSNNGAIEVD